MQALVEARANAQALGRYQALDMLRVDFDEHPEVRHSRNGRSKRLPHPGLHQERRIEGGDVALDLHRRARSHSEARVAMLRSASTSRSSSGAPRPAPAGANPRVTGGAPGDWGSGEWAR